MHGIPLNKEGSRTGKMEDSKACSDSTPMCAAIEIMAYSQGLRKVEGTVQLTSSISLLQTILTSTAMKVNIVKPTVNRVRPANVFHKTHSPYSRPFKKTTVLRTDFSKQKVNTAKVNAVSTVGGKRETAVKPSAGLDGEQGLPCEFQDFIGGLGKHFSGSHPFIASMLVQPTEDGLLLQKTHLKHNPTPSPALTKTSGGNLGRFSDQSLRNSTFEGHIKKLSSKANPVMKNTKSMECSVHEILLFDELDHMETENAQDVGWTRDIVGEAKENDEDVISTDKEKVSTDKDKREENGVELLRIFEETDRPRPTSTRSLMTLRPLPKIDPKDKGKKKIEEEHETDSESDDIPQAEKKFKQLESDEEMARKKRRSGVKIVLLAEKEASKKGEGETVKMKKITDKRGEKKKKRGKKMDTGKRIVRGRKRISKITIVRRGKRIRKTRKKRRKEGEAMK
ncbi:hypothetical protein Tco_0139644 [Tanacetum coccineum]